MPIDMQPLDLVLINSWSLLKGGKKLSEGMGVGNIPIEIPEGWGVNIFLCKWKIQRGGGWFIFEIPSVVGVWIFSGTTQYWGSNFQKFWKHVKNFFFFNNISFCMLKICKIQQKLSTVDGKARCCLHYNLRIIIRIFQPRPEKYYSLQIHFPYMSWK